MPTNHDEAADPLRPPDERTVHREINRSGSGGSGGSLDGDPREEGSGSESTEEMLAGREPEAAREQATPRHDAADEATGHDSTVERERTSEPDAKRTHVGWQVLDRDGDRLGRVVERDDASVLVELDGSASSRARVPLQQIGEESFDDRRATLRLSAAEVADLQERPDH